MQFASEELVEMAASCLDEITAEMRKDESKDSSAASSSLSLEAGKEEKDGTSQQVTSGSVEASTKDQTSCNQSTGSSASSTEVRIYEGRDDYSATRCRSIKGEDEHLKTHAIQPMTSPKSGLTA